jgi:cytochrome d ubiquinol oxidase subunit II
MSYADVALGLILLGLSAYLLFGGADFGAGLWHLVARRKDEQAVIEHAMGPVWEANHVWLIFVMVMTWTAFPPVFAHLMIDQWVPMSLAVLGIVIRGSTFVFAKSLERATGPMALRERKVYAWSFGVSSVLTPYCLGAVVGTVAVGRSNWLSPVGVYSGLLTVGLCAYLAAVYLTWDARRLGRCDARTSPGGGPGVPVAQERFRMYALATGIAVGILGLPGGAILGVRSPLIGLSALAGLVSLALLWRRAYLAVRVSAALAAGAVLWGAADLSNLGLDRAVAADAVLQVVFVALGVGGVILLPSLGWLYVLFQREAGNLS